MKSFFIKLLCMVLLFAMLLPLAVACKDDDDDDDNDDDDKEEEEEVPEVAPSPADNYFQLKVDSSTDSTLVDFSYTGIEKDGRSVYKWDMSTGNAKIQLPSPVSMKYCTSIRYTVYSESNSGATFEIRLVHGQNPKTQMKVVLSDFEYGKKSFDISSYETNIYGNFDYKIHSIELEPIKDANGDTPTDIVYISNFEMTVESYSYIAPKDVDPNDSALYTAITDNIRDTLVGNEAVARTSEYTSKISSINSSCLQILQQYRTYKSSYLSDDDTGNDYTPSTLFRTVNMGSSDINTGEMIGVYNYYQDVKKLAMGYGTIGSTYYKNAKVLEAIKFALEYGFKCYYGDALLERGTRGNWWHWVIGIPMELLPTLIIIESELTPELCAKYTKAFDQYVPYPSANGGNKIWLSRLSIMSAALRRNPLDLCVNIEYMNDIFNYISSYEYDEGGFFEDGSFVQHHFYAYTSGYGGNYTGDLPQLMYYLHDTRFFPLQDNVKNHYDWIIECIRPIVYNYNTMSSMSGRQVSRKGNSEDSYSFAASMILIHYYAPDEYKAKLEPMIAYFMQLYDSSFSTNVNRCMINYANELYARLKDVTVDPYETTRVFGMMCRTVHHGPKYGVALSYSNTKVGKYEALNDENMKGWYHGDGMIQIYTDDENGRYEFEYQFYCFADPYLMPGTTVNSAIRKAENSNANSTGGPINNKNNYAGGVAYGKYGTTGFILDYYDVKGDTFEKVADASIYAKKSYFFFDNEIVCIGSNISDSSGTNVKTVLENRLWRTNDTLTIGGAVEYNPSDTYTNISDRIVHFTNMGGYVILPNAAGSYDAGTLYYRKVTNGYNGTRPADNGTSEKYTFFEMYIDHGKNPEDGRYVYAYLPEATAEETVAYNANPDVAVLRRNQYVHAVIEKDLGIVACNFFSEKSSGETVTVDGGKYGSATAVRSVTSKSAASVMVTKNADGTYTISASNPSQDYQSIEISVTIDGASTVVSGDPNVSVTSFANGVINLTVNTSDCMGQTYNITVR